MVFGVKSDKQSDLIDFKKLVLILVFARILGRYAVVEKLDMDSKSDVISVNIKATLAPSVRYNTATSNCDGVSFALFDNNYRYRTQLREALL